MAKISAKLRHLKQVKKIAKEAMRNLIAEPNLYFENLKKDSMGHRKSRGVDSDEANASTSPQKGPSKVSYSDEEKSQGSCSSLQKIHARVRRRSSYNGSQDD